MTSNRVILKISGKIVNPRSTELLQEYRKVLSDLLDKRLIAAIVVGGGDIARTYITAASRLGTNRGIQDLLGIEVARLNARLLAFALQPYVFPEPVRSIDEALRVSFLTGKTIVAGGFQPGQSTAMVAMLLAEALGSNYVVLATTVDAVYDRDPLKYPNAKKLEKLTYAELRRVLEQSLEPGRYELLDQQAIGIAERSRIIVGVVDGRKPSLVRKAITDRKVGTMIMP